jgi:hypothetical protein
MNRLKKMTYFLLKSLAGLGLFIGLQQLIELKTRGFCLQKIQADDLPFQAQWEIPPLSLEEQQEIAILLSQPYTLLGSGSECFAFVSADGTTVIKLFKLDHARPVYFQKGLFLEDYSALAGTLSDHPLTRIKLSQPWDKWLKRFLGIREFRIQRTFSSLKLAYDELKQETGLLYLHLNPTTHFGRNLILYDASGIKHEIDLDSARFFLQKRAEPVEQHFAKLKKQQADALAEASIDSLIQLILERCKKGYADRDILDRNLGFIGTQAIEIDSGSFTKNPRMKEPWIYKQEIFYATLELKTWLTNHYPEMVGYLERKVHEEIMKDRQNDSVI